MATNAQINVTANTSAAQRAVDAIFRKDYNLNVNVKGGQPLGRITGDLSEFNKSMEAANARVIAFGASASVVYGIQKAFHSLVDSTIEVQKALNQIQVVLNVSNKDITQFGANLFNVAKQTGQSFETVAEAATLLSRQGLGMEETLKRTNDALVLSRITGMDAAKSVQSLTAAVNSFTSQAVTASEVVNKFATVDTQFAIGAKDLPEAIGRVGSSAAQAGVSLDQLIALVTATQVATARGGAVIGNSFKTIFTRLDRPKTQALLESLGIGTTDENGKAKGTIELLQSLAGAYEGLNKTQKSQVAEKVGGVFQINILKAALADLNKEYSVYGNALRVSSGATDDAYKRNEALNQTYAAQLNALQLNAKQLSANVGEKLLGPSMSKLIGGANSLLGGINEADSNSVGAKIANGILNGLGQVLSGPGLALIGGVLLKLLADFTKFAASGTKDLLGLNTAAKEQADLQKSVSDILAKDPSIYKQIETGAMSVNDVVKATLINLKQQTAELELQAKISAEIAAKAYSGGLRVVGGIAKVGKAGGYIPNFASDEDMEEAQARMLGARNPRAIESQGTIGGKKFLMNSEEDEIPNFASNGDSAVIPRYAGGWVPNFAGSKLKKGWTRINGQNVKLDEQSAPKGKPNMGEVDLGPEFASKFAVVFAGGGDRNSFEQSFSKIAQLKNLATGVARVSLPKSRSIFPLSPADANSGETLFDSKINSFLTPGLNNLIADIEKELGFNKQSSPIDAAKILTQSVKGTIFEKTLGVASSDGRSGLRLGDEGDQSSFDYRPISSYPLLQKILNVSTAAEAKISPGSAGNIPGKIFNSPEGRGILGTIANRITRARNSMATGYIPNFADALHESISREISAGAPKSGIYVKQYSELAGSDNPMGIGVFNSRDEGSPSKERGAIRRKGYARGYIPNFADDSVSGGGDMSGATTAMSAELASMVAMMAIGNKGIKQSFAEELANRKKANDELWRETCHEIESRGNAYNQVVADINAYRDLEKNTRGEALVELRETFGKEMAEKNKFIAQEGEAILKLKGVVTRLDTEFGKLSNPNLRTTASVASSAFGQQAALGLTFLGPILAQTLAAGIDQTTKSGRTNAAAVKGLGDVASYAGTGFMVGGAPGAVIGALIGTFSALNAVVKEVSTNLPELTAQAKKSSEEKTKTLNQQNVVLPLLEKIQDIRTQAGGVAGTAPELKIRGQILEATKEDQNMTNKIMASNYNFDSIKEIYIKEATIKTDKANETDLAKRIGEASESHKAGEDYDKSPIFGKNILSALTEKNEDQGVGLSKYLPKLYDSLDKLGSENFRDLVNLVSGGSAKMDVDATKTKNSIEAGNVIGKSIVSGPNVKKEDLISEYKNLSNVKSFSGLTEATGGKITSDVAKQLQNSGMQLADVIHGIKNQIFSATAAFDKGAKEAKKFSDEFGPIVSVLKNNKSALEAALNDFSKSLKIGADQLKFSGEFTRGRSEAKAGFLESSGFLGAAQKLGISNAYQGVVGKTNDENRADMINAIAESAPSLMKGIKEFPEIFASPDKINKEGEIPESVTSQTALQFNESRASQGVVGEGALALGDTINDILNNTKTATKYVSGLGNVGQYNVEAGVNKLNENPAVAQLQQNKPDEYNKLISGFKEATMAANDKLIITQRELAMTAAKKVDDLIKATIENYQRFGGGIESLLDNTNPNKASKGVEDSVSGLMLTEKDKKHTSIDTARQDLGVIKSVNNMMGGIPIFDEKNPIFQDLIQGTQDSIKKNLDRSEASLKKLGPKGQQTAAAMEDELFNSTGVDRNKKGGRDEALRMIAELQSAKATGLRTGDTAMGQRLYAQQEAATLKRLRGQGEQGNAMADLYEKNSHAGIDPTTDAVMGLQKSYETIANRQLVALEKLSNTSHNDVISRGKQYEDEENKKASDLPQDVQKEFNHMNAEALMQKMHSNIDKTLPQNKSEEQYTKAMKEFMEKMKGSPNLASGATSISPSFIINLAGNAQNVQAKMPEFEKDVKGVIHKHFGDQMTAAYNAAKKDPSLHGAPQTSKQYTVA